MSDCRFGVSPVNYPDPDCVRDGFGAKSPGTIVLYCSVELLPVLTHLVLTHEYHSPVT